jgi:hypothetical protein
MSNEAQTEQEDAMIILEGEDKHSYKCQILDIFEFENQEYALLLKVGEKGEPTEDDDGSLVIMRLIQRDDQSIFQTIESDEEFERVVAHVEEIARQNEDEPEEA